MSRTKGSLNRSKFTYIRLGDLCQKLKEDTMIKIAVDYANTLQLNSNNPNAIPEIDSNPLTSKPKEDKIDFVVHN